jgi:hypothetical protein
MDVKLYGIIEVKNINLIEIIDFLISLLNEKRDAHCILIDLISKNISDWYDIYSTKFSNSKIIEYHEQKISQEELDIFVREFSDFAEKNRYFEAAVKYKIGLNYLKKDYESLSIFEKIKESMKGNTDRKKLIKKIDGLNTSVNRFAKVAKKQKLEFIDKQESSTPKISLNDLKEAKGFLRDESTQISGKCAELIKELECNAECVNKFYNTHKNNWP